MKNALALALFSLLLGGAAAGLPPGSSSCPTCSDSAPPAPPAPPAGTKGMLAPPPVPQEQKIPFDQEGALSQLRAQIAGREKEPAEKVFKNIKLLRGVPAENLLRIMEFGYSRSLGATCVKCHTPADWSSDAKPNKEITRKMAALAADVSKTITDYPERKDEEPAVVNCTTCHRGHSHPATSLDPPPPAPQPGR